MQVKNHIGHIDLFRKLSEHGDVIVGILDDETVESYKRLPIMTHEKHCNIIKNLKYVKEIIPHCPITTTEKFMLDHNIYNVNISKEYFKPPYLYYEDCVRLNKYFITSRYAGVCTTNVIERIKNLGGLIYNQQKMKIKVYSISFIPKCIHYNIIV